MLKANINPKTSEIICPACENNNFKIFRRDKLSKKVYLNHCQCKKCGQLFVYNVDKKNNIVLEKNR